MSIAKYPADCNGEECRALNDLMRFFKRGYDHEALVWQHPREKDADLILDAVLSHTARKGQLFCVMTPDILRAAPQCSGLSDVAFGKALHHAVCQHVIAKRTVRGVGTILGPGLAVMIFRAAHVLNSYSGHDKARAQERMSHYFKFSAGYWRDFDRFAKTLSAQMPVLNKMASRIDAMRGVK